MSEKELMTMVFNEERRLGIGTPDFLRRHSEIMEEIVHIKNANRNIGKCDRRAK